MFVVLQSRIMRRAALTVACLLLLFFPATVFAQGCALCYTQAASSTARFIQALRSGILILIIPPMLMSVGFTVMTYRRRHTYHNDDQDLDH